LKSQEKEKEISQDEHKLLQVNCKKITDAYTVNMEKSAKTRKKEVMAV